MATSKLFCTLEKKSIKTNNWECLKQDISTFFPRSLRTFCMSPLRPYKVTKLLDTWRDDKLPSDLSSFVKKFIEECGKVHYKGYLYLDEVKILSKSLRENYPFSKLPSLKWSEEAIKQLKEVLEALEYIVNYPKVLVDSELDYPSDFDFNNPSIDLRNYRIIFWS